MHLFTRKILIIGRTKARNYGDSIIADCCKYIIEDVARHSKLYNAKVTLVDIHEKNTKKLEKLIQENDIFVFPGGGLNSVKFNKRILDIYKMIEKKKNASIYYNACGILKIDPNPKNEILLEKLFNHPAVKQVSTRGDHPQTLKYIHRDLKYPAVHVFDPAIWTDETYNIHKDPDSRLIGIGVIRPEIFQSNGADLSVEDIFQMYMHIIEELNKRHLSWQLFTNGYQPDYQFAGELLERMGFDKEQYLGANVANSRALVQKISSYQGIIAARLHANIIATSLSVPSVALVWNDKMNLFGEMIGHSDRYIRPEHLSDTGAIVDCLEKAMEENYNTERISEFKKITRKTIYNILRN